MKDEKAQSTYTPFNSFGSLNDDNLWFVLLLFLLVTPNLANDYDKISAKELEKKVSKLEGKIEILEKIIT